MATYTNDLRLKEIATGDESGTWGTSTNTNLSLIADAFGYGTKAIPTDANATFTMPDATADGSRALYLKITSSVSLTATRTVTLGPNTVSKVWIIENATTGSQSITISQGSGATVTIANGSKTMVYTDGAGAGAAVTSANPTAAAGGDVVGPASATDNAITRFDSTTGKLVQNSSSFVDDTGAIGIGTSTLTGYSLRSTMSLTSASSFANAMENTFSSAVTTAGYGYRTALGTAAAAFTLPNVYMFVAEGITVGAGSTVTSQYGFLAGSNMTGATNNYGFYGNIASGTGRYNLYMAGTAQNYLAGNTGIGGAPLSQVGLYLSRNITGATASWNVASHGSVLSDVTAQAYGFDTLIGTAASAFTLSVLTHYSARANTFGAGSAVTNQYGFTADSTLTGATNNYGFYGNIASGTGRYNLYMNGTADNYLAGSLGVGGVPVTAQNLRVAKAITGATTAYGVTNQGAVQSGVTGTAFNMYSGMTTAAASFTLSEFKHFSAGQDTIGAGSAVTSVYGFVAEASLTGGTINYGFYGNIASGSGRYNLYMGGTADNYLAGLLKIGAITARGTTAGTNHISLFNGTAPAGTLTNGVSLYSASGDFNFMDSSGNGYQVGFRNIPQNSQSAAYTLVLADSGKQIFHPSADITARTYTIPANSSVAYPIGTAITFINENGAGTITISITTDTMRLAGAGTSGSRTLAANGIATAVKVTSTSWIISGTGLT